MKKTFLIIATLLSVCALQSSAQTVSGKKGGHDYVDLGLPSGRLWATCNVGATKPTEYGDYFAWGETKPKKNYNWSTYMWCKGSENTMTKYCVDSDGGTVDSLTTLLAEDDAATANWGNGWRMPTHAEQQELLDGCEWKWADNYNCSGVAGKVGTSKANGNTIFLPAVGHQFDTDLYRRGRSGFYWSSSLYERSSGYTSNIYFDFAIVCSDGYSRYGGHSVRAVVK